MMNLENHQARSPGFLRRLAAMAYDLVLLFGMLMIAVTLVVVPYDLLAGTPFPHEERLHALGLQLYLIGVIGLFFVFFWVRGGQTLGMRTWHFQLVREDGTDLRKRDALARLAWAVVCLAPAGAGFFWMLLDRDSLTCYDRLSHTKPVMAKE
jgi:uncharacterized RDD family membrane protein YckC